MTDVLTAQPGQVFADPDGKLWRVAAILQQPSVAMTEIEPQEGHPPATRLGYLTAPLFKDMRRAWPLPELVEDEG